MNSWSFSSMSEMPKNIAELNVSCSESPKA